MFVGNPDNSRPQTLTYRTLEELFVAQETALLRYARRLVQHDEVAQDLVQDAFMKLHPVFSEIEHPRAWLYRTIHNMAMNHHRSARKIVPLEIDGEREHHRDPDPGPDERAENMDVIGHALRCVEALDERSRTLIRLKFEEGLSYKEMSSRTGLSVGNVGYLLHHALKNLGVELAKRGVAL